MYDIGGEGGTNRQRHEGSGGGEEGQTAWLEGSQGCLCWKQKGSHRSYALLSTMSISVQSDETFILCIVKNTPGSMA